MSKYHDHRSDCPFKFASLDVCDCVEHNMLDRIEELNKELSEAVEALRDAESQLVYLDERLPTGTTPTILARVRATLNAFKGET